MASPPTDNPQRILVVMPSWVGDAVMATPTLRALRAHYRQARIDALAKPYIRPIIDACPWVDAIVATDGGGLKQAATIRGERYDLAVLLPNSFRTALMAFLGRAKRRIGYARDGRGWMLTDRLTPLRENGKYIPTPTLRYYLDIARRLGAEPTDPRMELFTRPEHDQQAERMLRESGIDFDRPIVLLNPGAKYGAAKLWLPERFAETADRLIDQHGAHILLNGSPAERAILDRVHQAARHELIDLPRLGNNLTLLKSVIRRCDLMITNDTGPRHIAAALGVPVVTIFGPTDPRWTTIDCEREIELQIDVDCGPCQLKVCPLDHRCMTQMTTDMVCDAAVRLLEDAR